MVAQCGRFTSFHKHPDIPPINITTVRTSSSLVARFSIWTCPVCRYAIRPYNPFWIAQNINAMKVARVPCHSFITLCIGLVIPLFLNDSALPTTPQPDPWFLVTRFSTSNIIISLLLYLKCYLHKILFWIWKKISLKTDKFAHKLEKSLEFFINI